MYRATKEKSVDLNFMILDDSADDMMIIAFVTSERSLIPLMKGLCSSNPCGETYAYRFCDVSSKTIKVPIIITMFWVLQELLLATPELQEFLPATPESSSCNTRVAGISYFNTRVFFLQHLTHRIRWLRLVGSLKS